MRRLPLATLMLAAPLLSIGCSSYLGTARDFDPADLTNEPGWLAVEGVPLILQKAKEDCGAAALAMVLSYWGIPTSADDVTKACPPKPGAGIAADSLRDYARSKGLKAFGIFGGTIADLRKELSHRRPVIVGTVKLHVSRILTHFEVVIGYHPEKEIVLTLDPAHGWRQNNVAGFLSEWEPEPAKRLSLVIFKGEDTQPGEPTKP